MNKTSKLPRRLLSIIAVSAILAGSSQALARGFKGDVKPSHSVENINKRFCWFFV